MDSSAINRKPWGYVEKVDPGTGQVSGWAEDQDDTSTPISVHVYIDKNAPQGGVPIAAVQAADNRTDVGAHGFHYTIPNSYWDGKSHVVWIWGIDLSDTSGLHNSQLIGSGLSFTLQPKTNAPSELLQTPLSTDSSLLAYWRFEGNSNDSKGHYNGTDAAISYGAAYGKFGQGASFNGSSSAIAIGNNLNVGTGQFTVVGWVNMASVANRVIFGKKADGHNPYPGWVLYWQDRVNGTQTALTVNVSDGSQTELPYGHNYYTSALTGGWHHVAVVRGSTFWKVYLDGVDDTEGGGTSNSLNLDNTADFFIGGGNNFSSNTFNGSIDDVAFFNRALTPGEIFGLYSGNSSADYPMEFSENFDNAPNYTNNWVEGPSLGDTTLDATLTYTSGNLQLTASRSSPYPPGSNIGLLSRQAWTGDIDFSVQLNHSGFGRTVVGLWSPSGSWIAWAVLDTDDTNYLNFVTGSNSTEYAYAGTPYMNKWITLRIQVVGTNVNFYADNGSGLQLLKTWPLTTSPGPFYLSLDIGSVPWKSGDNITAFRQVRATGTVVGGANFQTDFQAPTPKSGWKYLWNSGGTIGNPANYTALVYCSLGDCNTGATSIYDFDGGAVPRADPAGYVMFNASYGHPGRGIGQGAGFDRFAIAAYTFPTSGHYSIVGSYLGRIRGTTGGDDQVLVHVDNNPMLVTKTTGAGNVNFDVDLGNVSSGQTVYVAVGPDFLDFGDSFVLQFIVKSQ